MQSNDETNPLINNEGSKPYEGTHEESETDNLDEQISEQEIAELSKAQVADKLEEYLAIEETYSVMGQARLLKEKYDELAKEEFEHKLKIFTQDGSAAEDFEPRPDPLDEKILLAWNRLNKKNVQQRKQKEKSLQENLSTKRLIIEELKELLKGNENLSVSYHKFQALQSKWRSIGNVPLQDRDLLRENYFFLTGKFYDMVKIINELRELDKKKNAELKTQLCEKAEKLNEEPSLKKALEGLRQLQKEWSEIRVSSREQKDPFWQRFKAAADKIIEKKEEFNKKQQQQQAANLVAKSILCEQLEVLAQNEFTSHKACREASEKVNGIWEAWQKIGFVPKSDNGNCWRRFKKSRQHFHRALDSFYAKQRSEFASNLEKKTELCTKAESLQDSNDWQNTSEILKKLQIDWKVIGPVAPKLSEGIWQRFRIACNHFFDRKANQHLEKENAKKAIILAKDALVTKVDSFQPVEDAQQNITELKKFQDEWSSSGEVPLREGERLNNNFGRAIEKLIERMKAGNKLDEKLFYRLKYEQMLKSEQGKEQIKQERFALQDKIKKLQAEVIQLENNLGFFGKSKNANPLIADYLVKVDKSKMEIQELATKLKFIPNIH